MNVGYVRVSTKKQNIQRQIDRLKKKSARKYLLIESREEILIVKNTNA